MQIRAGVVALVAVATMAQAAPPLPPLASVSSNLPPNAWAARVLTLHNAERARVGSVPLAWDSALATGAESWARYLAASGRLEHSDRKLRPGVGENLAMNPGRGTSPDFLVGLWIGEKRDFVPGLFPANSRSGNWLSVSHYTQLIWPTTTRVGCALAGGRTGDYLVCRYSPKGNADGRMVPALAAPSR